ncbi:MAG: hypothetical protein DSO07_04365 [Thermoproteota archaeon]|jgi:hypothetical protein|uniref:Uncharacterized protein n=1 Tax=Candidatus Methanodesulfokora washburnensis TaxID=2478471 RepID=A0A429GFJ0_9CREN|nr:hypothetical protein [Candidatus Methanodesulfokores washburnensis]RSN72674.1 hypothetical protein D6D85_12800 [Candidatus Methanodesulfokores washburnensis]TDA41480.1 MAG: hypothetical protein DSO07_04365 [Candidatus Korarchaeota archaeon]
MPSSRAHNILIIILSSICMLLLLIYLLGYRVDVLWIKISRSYPEMTTLLPYGIVLLEKTNSFSVGDIVVGTSVLVSKESIGSIEVSGELIQVRSCYTIIKMFREDSMLIASGKSDLPFVTEGGGTILCRVAPNGTCVYPQESYKVVKINGHPVRIGIIPGDLLSAAHFLEKVNYLWAYTAPFVIFIILVLLLFSLIMIFRLKKGYEELRREIEEMRMMKTLLES